MCSSETDAQVIDDLLRHSFRFLHIWSTFLLEFSTTVWKTSEMNYILINLLFLNYDWLIDSTD